MRPGGMLAARSLAAWLIWLMVFGLVAASGGSTLSAFAQTAPVAAAGDWSQANYDYANTRAAGGSSTFLAERWTARRRLDLQRSGRLGVRRAGHHARCREWHRLDAGPQEQRLCD
jgi:hypothetical protein